MSKKLNLGSFVVDPQSQEFQRIYEDSKKGNGWGCVLASYGAVYLNGKRVFVQYTLDDKSIRITHDGYRWVRDLTTEEAALAEAFDSDEPIPPKKVRVGFNLADGRWRPTPQQVHRNRTTDPRPSDPVARAKREGSRTNAQIRRRERHREVLQVVAASKRRA